MADPTGAPSLTAQHPTDGWTLVTHRRRPAHFLPSPTSPPQLTRTLNPLSPTYAQALLNSPLLRPKAPEPLPPARSHRKTASPPQSPNRLPYPPNPHQKEWWGRCFRCTRKGHVVAECPYPRVSTKNVPEPDQARTASLPQVARLVQPSCKHSPPVQPPSQDNQPPQLVLPSQPMPPVRLVQPPSQPIHSTQHMQPSQMVFSPQPVPPSQLVPPSQTVHPIPLTQHLSPPHSPPLHLQRSPPPPSQEAQPCP